MFVKDGGGGVAVVCGVGCVEGVVGDGLGGVEFLRMGGSLSREDLCGELADIIGELCAIALGDGVADIVAEGVDIKVLEEDTGHGGNGGSGEWCSGQACGGVGSSDRKSFGVGVGGGSEDGLGGEVFVGRFGGILAVDESVFVKEFGFVLFEIVAQIVGGGLLVVLLEEGAKFLDKEGGVGGALFFVFVEVAQEKRGEIGGEIGAHRLGVVGFLGEDGEHDGGHVFAGKGAVSGAEFVEDNGEGVDIGADVELFGSEVFGGHIGDGAFDDARLGFEMTGGSFGDAEVDDLELSEDIEEKVSGFDIAVDEVEGGSVAIA